MANLKISGVWKDQVGVITHYAMHIQTANGHTRAKKTNKAEAVKLIGDTENITMTWLWDYQNAFWKWGKGDGCKNSYLRSNPDK
jgi:hypothetical protein